MERIETHHHLPTEIIAEIFSRLPVKTLMRLRCVTKSWYNIIHDPIFITMYTAAANTRKTNTTDTICYILHHLRRRKSNYYDFRFLDWGKYFTDHMIPGPPLDVPSSLHNFYLYERKIEASCNGLVCFSLKDRLFLWNPSIGKVKELATCNYNAGAYYFLWNPSIWKVKKLATCNYNAGAYYYHYCAIGFYFCPQVDDYKVVKISYSNSNIKEYDQSMVQVYTLSTNLWKTVRVVVPCIACSSSGKTSLNGAFHWLAYKKGRDGLRVVLAFDFEGEVFQEILLPNIHTLGLSLFLGKFRDSMSVIAYPTNFYNRRSFDVWVMKEYGVVESWTKVYTVQEQIQTPLWFGNTGVILFQREGNFISYDCENQHYKFLEHNTVISAVIYDESLVLLNEDDEGECSQVSEANFGSKKRKQV